MVFRYILCTLHQLNKLRSRQCCKGHKRLLTKSEASFVLTFLMCAHKCSVYVQGSYPLVLCLNPKRALTNAVFYQYRKQLSKSGLRGKLRGKSSLKKLEIAGSKGKISARFIYWELRLLVDHVNVREITSLGWLFKSRRVFRKCFGYFLNIKKNLDYFLEYFLKILIVFKKLIFEKLLNPNRARGFATSDVLKFCHVLYIGISSGQNSDLHRSNGRGVT